MTQWFLGILLVLSSLGVILASKPVYSALSFLVTLLSLAALYLQLSASFIAVMQVFVYAGAILVIFMFVIILFQDAHFQISQYSAKSSAPLLILAAVAFALILAFLGREIIGMKTSREALPAAYGSVESLGKLLYTDYFFPFEAITLLFLIALIGALYTARRES